MMEAPAPNPPCTVNPCAIHASQSSEKSMTSPEPACRQSLPKLPLSDCGVTRTLCQPETQVYPESRLKCVPLHCKAAWSWANFTQSKPADCAVRHRAASSVVFV